MPMPASSSAGAELDRDGSGFYITFVVEEGELFAFGAMEIESAAADRHQGACVASC